MSTVTTKQSAHHDLLGIMPGERITHYRLLGINEFENNKQVIENAYDQRMIFLKQQADGRHATSVQEILNAVTHSRNVLLNDHEKFNYDNQLRMQIDPFQMPDPPQTLPQTNNEALYVKLGAAAVAFVLICLSVVLFSGSDDAEVVKDVPVVEAPVTVAPNPPAPNAEVEVVEEKVSTVVLPVEKVEPETVQTIEVVQPKEEVVEETVKEETVAIAFLETNTKVEPLKEDNYLANRKEVLAIFQSEIDKCQSTKTTVDDVKLTKQMLDMSQEVKEDNAEVLKLLALEMMLHSNKTEDIPNLVNDNLKIDRVIESFERVNKDSYVEYKVSSLLATQFFAEEKFEEANLFSQNALAQNVNVELLYPSQLKAYNKTLEEMKEMSKITQDIDLSSSQHFIGLSYFKNKEYDKGLKYFRNSDSTKRWAEDVEGNSNLDLARQWLDSDDMKPVGEFVLKVIYSKSDSPLEKLSIQKVAKEYNLSLTKVEVKKEAPPKPEVKINKRITADDYVGLWRNGTYVISLFPNKTVQTTGSLMATGKWSNVGNKIKIDFKDSPDSDGFLDLANKKIQTKFGEWEFIGKPGTNEKDAKDYIGKWADINASDNENTQILSSNKVINFKGVKGYWVIGKDMIYIIWNNNTNGFSWAYLNQDKKELNVRCIRSNTTNILNGVWNRRK